MQASHNSPRVEGVRGGGLGENHNLLPQETPSPLNVNYNSKTLQDPRRCSAVTRRYVAEGKGAIHLPRRARKIYLCLLLRATLRRQTNSLSCTRRQQQPGVFMAGPGSDSGRLVSVRRACPPHPSSATLLPNILSGCNPRSRNLSLPAYSPHSLPPMHIALFPLLHTRSPSHSVLCTPFPNHSLLSPLHTTVLTHSLLKTTVYTILFSPHPSSPYVLYIRFTSQTFKVFNARCDGVANTPPHRLRAVIPSPFIIPCSTPHLPPLFLPHHTLSPHPHALTCLDSKEKQW